MILDLATMRERYAMQVHGVLHCGAHLAEEAASYEANGMTPVTWVEANPAVIPLIQANIADMPDQRVVCALLWDRDGVVLPFHVTNYDGMSSSVLEFGTHPEFSPDTVVVDVLKLPSCTIDTLVAGYGVVANFLVMDLQGVELHALEGARTFMAGVDYVMSEVNCAQVYKGADQVEQLDAFLAGFERVDTSWVGDQGWGDALWVRR